MGRMYYFRRHELRCSTEGACGGTVPHILLTKTIISNLDMTIKSEENVIEFKISIDDAVFVEIFQRQANLCSVKS
jgi:hypothetical protein